LKVIHQPFGRRNDSAFFTYRGGGAAIHFEQHPCIGAYPRRYRASCTGAVRNALGNCKGLAMLFKTLDAEQFRADRFFGVSRERCGRALDGPQEYKIQTCLGGRRSRRGRGPKQLIDLFI
jgi:hypothetical protein